MPKTVPVRIRAFILVEIKLCYDQAQILTIRLPCLWLSNFIARSFSKLALFVKLFTLFSRSEIVLLGRQLIQPEF